ncbi:DUF418 domain-containing protein [Paenibacillus sp. 1P07SE]|uniref:DUF418 domain-containing protein n=1 Tax=Paenibacillus sp. 1P07SE TaxID=3132209 RepID=UPI0039A6C725
MDQQTVRKMTPERALAPDLGRGFMLLLIVVAHAPVYLFAADTRLMTRPLGEHALDQVINFWGLLFVDNRAYPMFAVLFGYGLATMVSRQIGKGLPVQQVKRLLLRRSWLLIVFGFIHMVIIGGADILAAYGVAGLVIGWLLFKRTQLQIRAIIGFGLVYMLLIPSAWLVLFPILKSEDSGMGLTATHTYLQLVGEYAMAFPFVVLINVLLYPMIFIISLGIWSARNRWLDQPERFHKRLKQLALGGISISMTGALPYALVGANAWHPQPEMISWFFILHVLTGVAGGLGYTALIAIGSHSIRRIMPRVTSMLVSVGKRSLTFYIYQELMLVVLLSPVAFGLGGRMDSAGALITAVLIWMSGIAIAVWLESRRLSGPADAIMRKLVYRRR